MVFDQGRTSSKGWYDVTIDEAVDIRRRLEQAAIEVSETKPIVFYPHEILALGKDDRQRVKRFYEVVYDGMNDGHPYKHELMVEKKAGSFGPGTHHMNFMRCASAIVQSARQGEFNVVSLGGLAKIVVLGDPAKERHPGDVSFDDDAWHEGAHVMQTVGLKNIKGWNRVDEKGPSVAGAVLSGKPFSAKMVEYVHNFHTQELNADTVALIRHAQKEQPDDIGGRARMRAAEFVNSLSRLKDSQEAKETDLAYSVGYANFYSLSKIQHFVGNVLDRKWDSVKEDLADLFDNNAAYKAPAETYRQDLYEKLHRQGMKGLSSADVCHLSSALVAKHRMSVQQIRLVQEVSLDTVLGRHTETERMSQSEAAFFVAFQKSMMTGLQDIERRQSVLRPLSERKKRGLDM